MARLHQEYKNRNVQVLALNIIPQYTEAQFLSWMRRYKGGDHAYATDQTLQVAQAYEVRSLGETAFIDRDGRIAARAYPPGLAYEDLKQVVEGLLQ